MKEPTKHVGIDGKVKNQADIDLFKAIQQNDSNVRRANAGRSWSEVELQQMVAAAVHDKLSQLRISGGHEIEVHGSGLSWTVTNKAGAQVQQQVAQVPMVASTSAVTYPLKIVKTASNAYKVLAGTCGGFSIAEFSSGAIAATRYVSIDVTVSYSTTLGVWTASAASVVQAGSYSSATSTKLVVQLGIVTFSGVAITTIAQASGGNQWVARTGSGTTYADANGTMNPLA